MKHLKIAISALLLVVCFTNANAQDKNNPWAIGFGTNAVDFYSTNALGMLTPGGSSTGWYDEFFNAAEKFKLNSSGKSFVTISTSPPVKELRLGEKLL